MWAIVALTERQVDRRVVLVTGASGGVGRGIAVACGRAGWTVWIAARRQQEGEAVAAEVGAAGGTGRFVNCDVGTFGSADHAVATIVETDGRLDAVVHNATSSLSPKPVVLADLSLEELRDHVAVAARGMYLLAKAAARHLEASQGSYVILTSEAGFEGKSRLSPYAAVKAAQRGMARSLAREWGPRGIRVNCVAPLAATPAMAAAFAHDPEMKARVLGRNPLGRLGDPVEDIGPVVQFLLTPEAGFITGNTLMVDGGSCPIS